MYANNNLIEKYREQAISTMSQGELIVSLYDEVIKDLKYASSLHKQGNDAAARKCTDKCRSILNYLIVILDDKYELSARLRKLYSFMVGQIIITDATGDTSRIDAIVPQLEELRGAWAEAEKNLRTQGGSEPMPKVPKL
jgi:flagellar protein FliS